MEEIATSYLDELINRNMVQVKEMKTDDRIKTCQIHDLIRELSITKAKEEISFEILGEEGNSQSSRKPRHRAMYCTRGRFIDSTDENKYLRSLFLHGSGENIDGSPSSYWKSFELLKILDFEGFMLEKLPEEICTLIGLKYLGLKHTGVEELPRSLGKLKNLQVLDLPKIRVRTPNVVWKMESLRHLYASTIYCKEPLKLSTLKNIQTLGYVVLRDSNIKQVKKMISLRKLGIDLYEISDVSKLFTSLAMLENLDRLNLRGCGSRNMDGLGTLHHLTQLALRENITRWPSANNFPPNLTYLSLFYTRLEEDPMPVLEKLPKLLYLKFRSPYWGTEMVITDNGFPRLKVVILHWLDNLRNIQIGKGAMSELRRLEIDGCPLKSLPEEVKVMSNLKELKMVTTTELISKLQGVDYHIISNIPSVRLISDPYLDSLNN